MTKTMTKTMALIGLSALIISCNKEEASIDNLSSEKLTTTALSETLDKLYFDEDISTLIQSTNLSIENSTFKSASTLKDGSTFTSINADDGRKSHGEHRFDGDEYGSCAVVTIDTIANTKLIDFGTGCLDRRGDLRSGQILISYSNETDVVGSFRQVEFIDFFKDSINILGTRRMEIINIDEDGNQTTKMTLLDGKMVYPDGTFKVKNSEMIRFEYKDTTDSSLNYSTTIGNASGIDTDGIAYSMEITSPIKFVRNCREIIESNHRRRHRRGRKIPVQGVKVQNTGTDIITIDFGDGTCDTLADVTTNGNTETVDISTLSRGDDFEKLFRKRRKH